MFATLTSMAMIGTLMPSAVKLACILATAVLENRVWIATKGVLKLYFRMGHSGLLFFAGMEQEARKSLCIRLLRVDRLKDLIGLFTPSSTLECHNLQ